MPRNVADLDALLAQKNYFKLGGIFKSTNKADEILLNMNWQRSKITSGTSAFINFAYIFDLDRLGNSLPGNSGANLKKSAVLVWLHTYALIVLDGVKCKDFSAPVHRKDQLLTAFPRVIKFMPSLSDAEMVNLINGAARLEAATASKRADDDFLCRDGMAQMQAAFKKYGNKAAQEVPTPPGSPGKTMAVRDDPDYKPEFLAKEVWEPKQKELRASMPNTLAKLAVGIVNRK